MKAFMDDDFLLCNDTAKHLYHTYAKQLPIIDYHCHLSPKQIYEDVRFENITGLWLGGDHYKWRLMRSNGVEEEFITGNASDRDKFQKWAETLEMAIGNPLYHWSHLELKRYFAYDGVLDGTTAERVWQLCREKLSGSEFSARNLIRRSGVEVLCTTDDPADDLVWHEKLRADGFETKVLPSFRPDRALSPEKENYPDYLERLGEAAGMKIGSFRDLTEALKLRMDHFEAYGCKISDHGLPYIMYEPASEEEVENFFMKRLKGESLSAKEIRQFKTALLLVLAREYHKKNWVMQLHYGVQRDLNTRIYHKLGPDAGIDAIDNRSSAIEMGRFLDALDVTGELPKTILYALDPADYAAIGTVMGCFQDSSAVGKIQHGAAWWFNDHRMGMVEQMTSLANLGSLGNFVGMLTDSRSFLSYTRHEYFRRILCGLLGEWVENGEYPDQENSLKKIVEGISYYNAKRYFDF